MWFNFHCLFEWCSLFEVIVRVNLGKFLDLGRLCGCNLKP